jgi:Family of unknown function (DUF5372)
VCVGERYNRSGKRLLLRVDDGVFCSVPPQWTDLVGPAAEVALGRGRALFLVDDLLELASLVMRLSRKEQQGAPERCKENDAANAKTNMSHKR